MNKMWLTFLFRAAALTVTLSSAALVFSQDKPSPQQPADDVIRVNTELVQTDVTVLDKKGRFVDGLKPEQFELIVDKKTRQIAFVDRVSSESGAQIANKNAAESNTPGVTTTKRLGRTVLFYVDDVHLAPDSLMRARKALLDFIDKGLGPKDQVAITSASGQVGFLQQFTDDKSVLQLAVARLSYQSASKVDTEQPPMSEYMLMS